MMNIYILNFMYEWDEHKNKINREKHGVSFENAKRVFEGLVLKNADTRFDYNEPRFRAIGALDDLIIVAIYTVREGSIRLISARLANQRERRAYCEALERSAR